MLYLCDPNKNVMCKKSDCSHLTLLGECYATKYPEFAVQNAMGKPIRVKDLWVKDLWVAMGAGREKEE